MSTSQVARLLVVGSLAVSVVACATATFEASSTQPSSQRAKVAASSVLVLKSTPSAAYQDLGSISVQWKGKPDDEAIFRLVREKAASVGANAVLYVDSLGHDTLDFDSHWGGSAEDGAISRSHSSHRTYNFRALWLPYPLPS